MKFDLPPQTYLHDPYEADLDSLLSLCETSVNTEDWKTFWRTAGDVFIRVIHNLKHTFMHPFQELKRSELRAFLESHRSSMKALMAIDYSELSDEMIFFPHGMHWTYPELVRNLKDLYELVGLGTNRRGIDWLTTAEQELAMLRKTLVLEDRLEVTRGKTLSVHQSLLNRAERHSSTIAQKVLATKGQVSGDGLTQVLTTYSQMVFQAGNVGKDGVVTIEEAGPGGYQTLEMISLGDEFNSTAQLQHTLGELIGCEQYLIAVPSVLRRSAQIEASVDGIITAAVDNDNISRDALTALAVEIRLIARMLHLYGFANALQMVTEHNLALSLNRLIEAKL